MTAWFPPPFLTPRPPVSVEALRRTAQRKLPAPAYHYVEGDADDEVTLRRNRVDFEAIALLPHLLSEELERAMVLVSVRSLSLSEVGPQLGQAGPSVYSQ